MMANVAVCVYCSYKVKEMENSRFGEGPTKTVQSTRDIDMLPPVERALRSQRAASQLRSPWIFPNRDGGTLDMTNLRERVWKPAVRRDRPALSDHAPDAAYVRHADARRRRGHRLGSEPTVE